MIRTSSAGFARIDRVYSSRTMAAAWISLHAGGFRSGAISSSKLSTVMRTRKSEYSRLEPAGTRRSSSRDSSEPNSLTFTNRSSDSENSLT
ncbi:MAG: hypothetical protein HY815_03550 [Candidatus Riflebacteria bacterium]|nr:hypothetical protein [Candidatus Riflebacteria bacterium]